MTPYSLTFTVFRIVGAIYFFYGITELLAVFTAYNANVPLYLPYFIMKYLVPSVALYFLASWLASITVWKIKNNFK